MSHRDWREFKRRTRLMEKGDFKYVILDLLKDRPGYGYELIRALEERFRGFYAPSAGVVYPTLQMLEDLGYVTSSQQDGRKIYTITPEGLKFLSEQGEVVDEIKSRMRDWWGWSPEVSEEMRDMAHEMKDFAQSLSRELRGVDVAKVHRIHEVLDKAYRDIQDIVRE
ncbi:MAG: PadR family transcriptional regulator [Chloroflexi bacterium]|nr:PadR family transcriptional regulator [Chloroflexota bacterium]